MNTFFPSANDSNSDIMMSVDIFDQSYKSVVETDADKVVDVQLLAKLLPLSSYKRFVSLMFGARCGLVDTNREFVGL